MERCIIVQPNNYVDSLASLLSMTALLDCSGIETAYVGMATAANKATLQELGLYDEQVAAAGDGDFIIAAMAQSQDAFQQALLKLEERGEEKSAQAGTAFSTLEAACQAHPQANLCCISVPGEYALAETKKALDRGLHCVVFSNNVPLDQEREMKEYAQERGLLCMGPDCGVTNINGVAFVLASINNRGPFGICGASGCGIQHVAAILHEAGSGVSQTIGTGGNDLKEPVGGISMLMGIDALENDPDTEYIVLISRKPAQSVLEKILDRVSRCQKPVVVLMMGCERELIERSGGIYAENLDDCGQKALALIGKECAFATEEELDQLAAQAVQGMSPQQKYVRGVYCGGTYCDEAMNVLVQTTGSVHSNCPLKPEWKLQDSTHSVFDSVVDYGEEEFTLGKPHPTIEPTMRLGAVDRESDDPETAVILMDFILTPPEHIDPAGVTVPALQRAMEKAKARGGRLAVVASVLGTDADLQNVTLQRQKLRDAGVYVCRSNRQAAQLAGKIARLLRERNAK